MFDVGIKPKWWYPIVFLFAPGSCYAYSSYYPSFRMDFAVIGIVLTVGIIFMAAMRVIMPRRTETHTFRMIAAQLFTLSSLLISYRFWDILVPQTSLVVFLILLVIYLLSWLVAFYLPKHSQFFYRFFWYSRQPMFTIVTVIGGLAGAYGLIIGMDFFEYSKGAQFFAAIVSIIIFVVSSFYFSASLWRQQKGKSPIPFEEA